MIHPMRHLHRAPSRADSLGGDEGATPRRRESFLEELYRRLDEDLGQL